MNTLVKSALRDTLRRPVIGSNNLNINIARYYTDVDGVVIDKSAAPAALQIKLPVYLLGNFDRVGGFNIAQKALPTPSGAVFLMTYLHGYGEPFLWNSGLNTIAASLKFGDVVTVFTDSLDTPTGFVFMVQTVQYGALGSIISNTQTIQDDGQVGLMHVRSVSMQASTDEQFSQAFSIVKYDNLGTFQSKNLNPGDYKGPLHKLNDFVEIPLSLTLTQYNGVNFYFVYACDYINFNFRIAR